MPVKSDFVNLHCLPEDKLKLTDIYSQQEISKSSKQEISLTLEGLKYAMIDYKEFDRLVEALLCIQLLYSIS